MSDTGEKSTKVPAFEAARAEVASGVFLDGRLALHHTDQNWLAISDLHFGYEVSRRREGGLWPMWGMETITERLESLLSELQPDTLILVGDIVDSAAAPDEAIRWLKQIEERCGSVLLIEGNHDRGEVKRHFAFQPFLRWNEFFFHHGHHSFFESETKGEKGLVEITGHRHPSIRFNDGAGTSLKLPALTMEDLPDQSSQRWILPAFSPWSGGAKYAPDENAVHFREWACSTRRVFEAF